MLDKPPVKPYYTIDPMARGKTKVQLMTVVAAF
jgi:hypothetical protein